MSYFKCDGIVTDVGAGAYQCSTGWQLDVPVPLVSQEQADLLIFAIISLVVVVAIIRELATIPK